MLAPEFSVVKKADMAPGSEQEEGYSIKLLVK